LRNRGSLPEEQLVGPTISSEADPIAVVRTAMAGAERELRSPAFAVPLVLVLVLVLVPIVANTILR
jgi:hypothetical protein